MHSICCSEFILGHIWCSWTPATCSWMIYSVPIGFDGLSFQSRIFGIGSEILDYTIRKTTSVSMSTASSRRQVCRSALQYVIVATSKLVVNLGGPAIPVGNFATTQEPVSIVKRKTLLNPPSLFSHLTILVASGHRSIALSQSAEKSKTMWRESRSSSSRLSHLPLV